MTRYIAVAVTQRGRTRKASDQGRIKLPRMTEKMVLDRGTDRIPSKASGAGVESGSYCHCNVTPR